MANDITAELRTRRDYWQEQYRAARASGDDAAAERALKGLRLFEWILEEGNEDGQRAQ